MSRIRPDERATKLRDPGTAWAALLEHGSEVFDRMQYQLAQVLGRSVKYVGEPFSGSWHTGGYFVGRRAVDFIEEVEAGLLEAAAHAIEIQEDTKGNLNTILSKVLHDALQDELDYWKDTSSGRGPNEQLNAPLLRAKETGAGVYEEEIAPPDVELDEDEVTTISVMLTEEEAYAVRREGDGASQADIAQDLDQFFPLPDGDKRTRRQAQTVLDRALRKARTTVQ
jgi:hypothetical protein